jgi:hypothetical protein
MKPPRRKDLSLFSRGGAAQTEPRATTQRNNKNYVLDLRSRYFFVKNKK